MPIISLPEVWMYILPSYENTCLLTLTLRLSLCTAQGIV